MGRKFLVTFEVDQLELFNRLVELKSDHSALGLRLVEALMPGEERFLSDIGLMTYGIKVVKREDATADVYQEAMS